MQLDWDEHFENIVLPAWQAYLAAETKFVSAMANGNSELMASARYGALREGGAAAFYIHHYGEIVLRAHPPWLHANLQTPREVMGWLAGFCTMLRGNALCDDVALLGDVTEALKHSILTRRRDVRQIDSSEAVLVAASIWSEMNWGEGEWGGERGVLIRTRSGTRALSTVLQNVIDAWRRAMGRGLPEIGDL